MNHSLKLHYIWDRTWHTEGPYPTFYDAYTRAICIAGGQHLPFMVESADTGRRWFAEVQGRSIVGSRTEQGGAAA